MKENHLLLIPGEGVGISLTLFPFLYRKQVRFPVELKSSKTNPGRESTCQLLMILECSLIFKTQI